MSESPILRTEGVTRRFGNLVAVDQIDFGLPRGELHGIIGPNGAGKTTFFNMLTGLLEPSDGRIWFEGEEITHLPPHKVTKRGMAMAFQITSVFPKLTVMENVIGAINGRDQVKNPFRRYDADAQRNQRAREILEQVGLAHLEEEVVSTLSHGDQKVLELALALGTDPELLLLDEPTAGLSASETETVSELLEDIRTDKTIILIEHDMDFVMNLVDTVTVFHNGEILAAGSPDEIRGDERVKEVYFGRDINA